MEGRVKAICISSKRGTVKRKVNKALFIDNYGIENDAHAGNWHRQVSLLSYDKVKAFNQQGAAVQDGDFGENLLVEGIDFKQLPVGTTLSCNEVQLELTQIGKECHSHCQIYQRMGECIMPREGVFARVVHGGIIQENDRMRVVATPFRAAVITMSDKASRGQREDTSGPTIVSLLKERLFEVVEYFVLPDDPDRLSAELIRLSDDVKVDLILTTGGTGFSLCDQTPEATLRVMSRNAPGIAEAIRFESMKYTKRAMLSRGVSVIRNQTLIVNLPGSRKAVKESMEIIMDSLEHGLAVLCNGSQECGRHD